MYTNALVSIMHCECIKGIILKFDDEKLLVRCHKGHTLQDNEKLKFHIYHPLKGELYCTGILAKAFPELLIIEKCKIENIYQLRDETRVDLDIFVTIKRMFFGPEMKELTKFIPMNTKNLSASGAGLFSKFDIPLQTRLIFDLPLDKKVYYIDTHILRKEPWENGFYYGCRFADLPLQIQSKIRSFVYQKQIDQKKQEKI